MTELEARIILSQVYGETKDIPRWVIEEWRARPDTLELRALCRLLKLACNGLKEKRA